MSAANWIRSLIKVSELWRRHLPTSSLNLFDNQDYKILSLPFIFPSLSASVLELGSGEACSRRRYRGRESSSKFRARAEETDGGVWKLLIILKLSEAVKAGSIA